MYGGRAFDVGKVTVMPKAIEPARFAFDRDVRQRLRAELGFSRDTFVVGHVGRFLYQKNHRFLAEVFAALAKERPNARLLLVGEGDLLPAVRRQVQALGLAGRVVFVGPRQDVDKLYSAMNVFCLPSRYEGMPVVAWEAQANGLPCVFSGTVTKEASCGPNAIFARRDWTREQWVQALCSGWRAEAPPVSDIRDEAVKLRAFYENRQEGSYENQCRYSGL